MHVVVVLVVVDVVTKIDVVDVLNCDAVVVDAPNCGIVVVVAPNIGTELFIVLKLSVVPLVLTAAGRIAAAEVILEVVEAPKTNRGLLVDKVDVEGVEDVLTGKVDTFGNLKVADVVVVVQSAINELFVVFDTEVFGLKSKDLICKFDVLLLCTLPKAFVSD